jgi:hypothetical protein
VLRPSTRSVDANVVLARALTPEPVRQVINFSGQRTEKITIPTPVQARAFDLLGSAIPVRLT